MKDKRIRINKRLMAWSNGSRINIVPSLRSKVDDYGSMMGRYSANLEEGFEIDYGECSTARERSRIREYEADKMWENEHHLEAFNEMIRAAIYVLPDEDVFEDVQWFNPEETLFWHPNIREHLRLMRRCIGYCKQDSRLWPILESEPAYQNYRKYLNDLGSWVLRA